MADQPPPSSAYPYPTYPNDDYSGHSRRADIDRNVIEAGLAFRF